MTRRSPRLHWVKGYTREGKRVETYRRGHDVIGKPKRLALVTVGSKINERINEVAQILSWKVDKWMPDDQDLQDEFYESDAEGRKDIIDEYIDSGFERYFAKHSDMQFISTHRAKIVAKVASSIG